MRYLAIDYGTKKCGIAVSDDSGTMAFARDIVATDMLLNFVTKILKEEHFDGIVIGHSQSGSGIDNPVMQHIYRFKTKVEETHVLPVYLENEFGTSAGVHRTHDFLLGNRHDTDRKTKKPTRSVDDQAAALILQRFLDKQSNS